MILIWFIRVSCSDLENISMKGKYCFPAGGERCPRPIFENFTMRI